MEGVTMGKRIESMGGEGQNAAAILAEVKAQTGRFRELKGYRFACGRCPGDRRTLVRVYVGADDEGEVRHWFLIAGHASTRQKIPPTAYALEVYRGALVAECPRCRAGYVFFHDGTQPYRFRTLELGSPIEGVVSE